MGTTSNTLNSRIWLKDAIPLSVPLAVYFDITNKCNFTCPWCPTGNDLYPDVGDGMMTLDLFKKIIDDFVVMVNKNNKRIKTLNLFWMGEPLLNKNIYEMAAYAKDAGIADRILLTNNGSLLNSNNSKKIIDSGVDVVLVSFYGVSNQDYKVVHRSIGFEKIVENARTLLKIREKEGKDSPLIVAKFYEQNEELENLLINELKCVDVIAYESPFNWSSEYSKRSGQYVQIQDPGSNEVCPSPWFVMSIGWEGHVGVCCADWKYDIDVGNLKDQSVTEVWNGQEMLKLRRKIAEKKYNEIGACNGCSYYKITHDQESCIDDLIRDDIDRALSLS